MLASSLERERKREREREREREKKLSKFIPPFGSVPVAEKWNVAHSAKLKLELKFGGMQ